MRGLPINLHTAFLLCVSFPILLYIRLQLGDTAGHMDEYDYLFVGKLLLSGGHWPTHTYIFGWDINWLILAWGERTFGGLEGARLVSAIFGGLSLVGMYTFVFTLWRNHTVALIAVLLLGFEAAHLYSSRLATYDILSFTAFVWSLPSIVLACRPSQTQWLWTVCASITLSIAVLSKYTVVLYLPFIAITVLWLAPRQAVLGTGIITLILSTYVASHFDQLQTLYDVQISGAHSANASYADILYRITTQTLVLLFLTGLGVFHAIRTKSGSLPCIALLLLFSLPVLLYHLAGENVISLQKHLSFTSLFLIPIAAWWLNAVYQHAHLSNIGTGIVLACLGVFALANHHKLTIMQSSYPNVGAFEVLTNDINANHTILSEDPYLFRYWLFNKVAQAQISETTWLDNDMDGKHTKSDVKQAIWDRKFDYVFINDQQHSELNKTLREMLSLRDYQSLLTQPYRLNTMSGEKRVGVMSLYRKRVNNVSSLQSD